MGTKLTAGNDYTKLLPLLTYFRFLVKALSLKPQLQLLAQGHIETLGLGSWAPMDLVTAALGRSTIGLC